MGRSDISDDSGAFAATSDQLAEVSIRHMLGRQTKGEAILCFYVRPDTINFVPTGEDWKEYVEEDPRNTIQELVGSYVLIYTGSNGCCDEDLRNYRAKVAAPVHALSENSYIGRLLKDIIEQTI